MIDFEKKYIDFSRDIVGSQKRLEVNSVMGIYYGMSEEGLLRLSFLSSIPAPKLDSTKLLQVFQGRESDRVYWTCFDLMNQDAQKVYFAFCSNLVEAVEGVKDENIALQQLKKRYLTWKTMFRKDISAGLSREVIQGLFGELYFLKTHLIPQYNATECIKAWSGPDSASKDFSIGNTWFEVKTIGTSTKEVEISSIDQLTSTCEGHLCVLRVEKMSPEFSNGQSSIDELYRDILGMINDEAVEGLFLSKISSFGVDISDACFSSKFDVKSLDLYLVNNKFPRLNVSDIKFKEIVDVKYSLIVNMLQEYKEKK